MLYKFKVKKLLNLLEIDNLNLNNLAISSTKRSKDSTIVVIEASSTKRSKVIRRLLVKYIVATRVSTRYIFLAKLECYRSQHINI